MGIVGFGFNDWDDDDEHEAAEQDAYSRGLRDAADYLDDHIEEDPIKIREELYRLAKVAHGGS